MVSLLIALVVIGVLLYLLNVLVPMDSRIKTVINAIVFLIVFLYVLQAFGVIHSHNLPLLR
jgi:hypothetical protein